jgi:hypothetical protein
VVRGEPGAGKTALLDHLAGQAQGCRVLRTAGMQSEMELPFAGLHQLSAPMLDRLEQLPVPQRDVLDQPAELERDRGCGAACDEAAKTARVPRRCEQRGWGASAGGDNMRMIEPERVGGGDDELAHRPR